MTSSQRTRRTASTPATTAKPAARPANGWLRSIRERLGWPRRVVAEKLKVSPAAVRDFEAGELSETISLRTLRRTADALGCDVVITLVGRNERAALNHGDPPTAVRRPPKQSASPGATPLADGELESYLK